jgi:hypothetical protein
MSDAATPSDMTLYIDALNLPHGYDSRQVAESNQFHFSRKIALLCSVAAVVVVQQVSHCAATRILTAQYGVSSLRRSCYEDLQQANTLNRKYVCMWYRSRCDKPSVLALRSYLYHQRDTRAT